MMNGGSQGASLLVVRENAQRMFDDAGVLEHGWRVRAIRRLDHRSVVLDLGPEDGRGISLEWIEPLGESVNAFLQGDAYAVGYRTGPNAWDLDADETPADVKRIAASACEVLSSAPGGISLQDGSEEDTEAALRTVTLDPSALTDLLAPRLSVGQALLDDWQLMEFFPSGGNAVALEFRRADDGSSVRLKVRVTQPDAPAAYRASGLDVLYGVLYGDEAASAQAPDQARLAAEVALLLEEVGRGVSFQERVGAEPDPDRAEDGPPPALNLAIPAPCGVRCNFCSVREEVYVVTDAESAFVKALRKSIEDSGARGTKTLRINGIEPLNAPYLFHLLEVARDVGFEEFHLFSTCRPLKDPDFCDRYLAAMPARYRIHVPIYGSCAEKHDAIMDTPGAFDDMMQAVQNVKERMGEGGMLLFTTVLTQQNADDLVALRDLVKPLGRWWEVHLPFPNTSSRSDLYRDVAIRMSDALELVYPKGWWPVAELELGEVLPCVAFRHQRDTGHALITASRLRSRMLEPSGTFYRSAGFDHSLAVDRASAFTAATVTCPHTETCALAAACPGKVYNLYEELFGLDELQPVSRDELKALEDADNALREVNLG